MEVFNINNDRGVISIPRLKPRALITPRSLLIHYITASLICDTSTFDHGLNEIDVYV